MRNMAFSGVGNEKEQRKGQKWFCSILIIGPFSYISKEKQRLAKYVKWYSIKKTRLAYMSVPYYIRVENNSVSSA